MKKIYFEDEIFLNNQIFHTAQHIAELMFTKSEDTEAIQSARETISFMLDDYVEILDNKKLPIDVKVERD